MKLLPQYADTFIYCISMTEKMFGSSLNGTAAAQIFPECISKAAVMLSVKGQNSLQPGIGIGFQDLPVGHRQENLIKAQLLKTDKMFFLLLQKKRSIFGSSPGVKKAF